MNEHLLAAKDNDTTTPVRITLDGFDFQDDTLSGLVPEGKYTLVVNSAKWRDKKNREGKNLRIVFTVTAPEKYAGVQIVEHHPAPIGDITDNATSFGHRRLAGLFASVVEGLGRLEEFKQQKTVDFTPETLAGKYMHAELRQELDNNGNQVSKIARYIDTKEFSEAPGPAIKEAPVMPAPNMPGKHPAELFPQGTPAAPRPGIGVMPQQPQHAGLQPQMMVPSPDNGTVPANSQPPRNPASITGL